MVILQGKIDEIKKISPTQAVAEDVTKRVTETGSTWDSFMQLVGLVLLLIVILIAAFYTSKFVGKATLGQLKNSNFHVIDAYRISPNKLLQIVKIANKYIVIAISKDTITYITELDEAEVLIKDTQNKENLNFKQILDKLKNKSNDSL